MPQVKIPPAYRGTTLGEARVSVEGSTVIECIDAVESVYPGFRDQVVDPGGRVHRFVQLFVNVVEIDRAAIDTHLNLDDELEVLAAVAGG